MVSNYNGFKSTNAYTDYAERFVVLVWAVVIAPNKYLNILILSFE